MSNEHKPPATPPQGRPLLRLVAQPTEAAPAEVSPAVPPPVKAARRSPFLDYMNAYADAVDQQVKVLLEL